MYHLYMMVSTGGNMLVNQKMNALRKKKKLKLSDLEDRTGITVSTLSRYERGTIKFIPPESVRKIAASLDTTFEDLTEGDLRYASIDSVKKRQPYQTTKQSTTIQSDEDLELLYSFHRIDGQYRNIVLNLCNTLAAVSKN